MEQCKNYFLTLNIFQAPAGSHQGLNEDSYEKRTQVVATRVYFILLVSILLTFLLITCLNSEAITVTVQNLTLDKIQSLPANRICPCSRISFSHDKFVSSNASFHQVCSSDFVSDRWISSIFHGINASYFLPVDFRLVGFAQFQALASFCQLSRASVNRTLLLFGSSPFISSYFDSSRINLRTKVLTTVNSFQSSISTTFKSRIQLISTIIMSNHLLNALGTNIIPNNDFHSLLYYQKQVAFYANSYLHAANATACMCERSETLTNESCRGPSGFYEEYFDVDVFNIDEWHVPTMFIPNFTSSCMPVDACLLSSLECFFNQSCVNAILSYQRMNNSMMWNFTALNSDNALKPSHFNMTSRIKSIVDELMVEEWLIEEDYEKYFQQCAPVVCTYLKNVYPDFLNVLNILIGLFGGLCAVLHLIVLPVVRFSRKRFWPPPANSEPSESLSISFIVRLCRQTPSILKRFLIELNFFKTNSNDDNDQSQIRYQRIMTRLYVSLLALSLVIITLYLVLTPQLYIKTIENLTPAKFSHFHSHYPLSLQCPCSNISIPYNVFITIKPHYYQMCSSDLVSPKWLDLMVNLFDVSHSSTSHFLLLKKLCIEAKQTINNSLEQFLNEIFITSQAVSEETFENQTISFIEEWKTLMINNFLRTLQLVRATQYGNHLAAGDSNSYFDIEWRSNTFILNSSIHYDQCNCMLSPWCSSPMKIYYNFGGVNDSLFEIPGFLMGCFLLDALLNSTLECFYNETCMNSIDIIGIPIYVVRNFTALNATRNLPNETIDSIVSKLFVDEWSQNISFSNYFAVCAPQSCTYEYSDRQSLISLLTSIISLLGGLSTGLEIILFILLWLMTKMRRGNRSLHAVRTWLHTRLTEKQYWNKGAHFVFVVTTLTALVSASIFTLQTTINQDFKPTIETYEELFTRHSDTLQCPCIRISIPYKFFMNVTVSSRHQVCSSSFITDQWIETLLLPDVQSSYSPFDFQKTAIGFFQLLASLCKLSEEHLIDELSDLMTRSLINTNVISRLQFNEQIQSIINQFQLNTPLSFLTTLQLIRAMTSDNKLMTVFETNWQWMPPNLNSPPHVGRKLHTKPIVYNGSCNCGLSSHCVEESLTMPGLMVGCYPLESLLKSTLECLYNVSCFSRLQFVNRSFTPLNDSSPTRYQKNSTVEFILNQLMVEQWNNSTTYENYYKQCAPSLCSYSYIGRRPAIQVLVLLLGLYGGLMIIIKIIALLLVALWKKMLIRFRRRHVQVQPM